MGYHELRLQCCQPSLSLGWALLSRKAVMDPTESSDVHCMGHTHDKESVNMDMALKGFFHSLIYSLMRYLC